MRALAVLRRRLLGLALLLVLPLAAAGSLAVHGGAFARTADVLLRTGTTGNQIPPEADVKVRGLVVGRVSEVVPAPGGAELRLALDPGSIDRIPANVTARLLPRTLFGERYVALEPPAGGSARSLADGDVIVQDSGAGAVELERVLADAMPLLRSLRPQQLATTLNGLSRALEGRGESTGRTIEDLNRYLAGLNPELPLLRENLRRLVGVAGTYEQAAPDVLRALGDLGATARTLAGQRAALSGMLSRLTTTSDDLTGYLREHGPDLIRVNASARPTLELLAEYSPEYPCVLAQAAGIVPEANRVLGVGTGEPGAHVTLEITPNRGAYLPGLDDPVFADERGPRCYPIERAPQYPPDGPVQDGTTSPPAARAATGGSLPASSAPDVGANSPAERHLIAALAAHPADGAGVPPWSSLLLGPVFRGAEVAVLPG
ncbi:MCE family protein [Saccharopolyspora sp. MS10]|uniref:MCE family protein n=1 Tax=Saccharopolyspora sp. MS10 TaxID=3385973 RepID=UPI0039A1C00C